MAVKERLIVPNGIETKPNENAAVTTYYFSDGTLVEGVGYYDTVSVITKVDHPVEGEALPPTPAKQWNGAISATEALLRKTNRKVS